jgi:ribonucleoside-diphosphate reductase subunit M1
MSWHLQVVYSDLDLIHRDGIKLQDKKPDEEVETKMAQMVCSLNNREECLACGS